MFRRIDNDGNKRLNLDEFAKGLRECGLGSMNLNEIDEIFSRFDKDRNGSISFNEFLEALRVCMVI